MAKRVIVDSSHLRAGGRKFYELHVPAPRVAWRDLKPSEQKKWMAQWSATQSHVPMGARAIAGLGKRS